MKDLRSADLAGKVVAVRVDLNVPTNDAGAMTDDTRMAAALPTLEYVAAAGAKVLVLAHFNRPRGRPDPAMSLEVLAEP
ncbi:MAG: phosphoglycerate kinase, partial [Chloroflexota bacterium]|nr:phosphoglycerate kinase [Chloroflexota bacterium]